MTEKKTIGSLFKNPVFSITFIMTLAIVVWAIAATASFGSAASTAMNFITKYFGWLYVGAVTVMVVYCFFMMFWKYKNVPLGPDGCKPEYSGYQWFSMLFSAGMGIGIIFWGIAEPMTFMASPINGMEPFSLEAQRWALHKAILHWGLNPWATFAVVALGLAYMMFRHGKPGSISSIFIPLLGEKRVQGAWGKVIDIAAAFATATGITTSLGMGTMQINSGMSYIFGVPNNLTVKIIIIVVLAFLYTWTAVIGIDKGISVVCDINVKVAICLMVALFVCGPTLTMLDNLVEGTGAYIWEYVGSTMEVGAFSEDASWYEGWTVFYWAWWVAWSPFTGSFIARVSYGRKIGEFLLGVMVLPTAFTIVWFSIMGTVGLTTPPEVTVEAVKDSSLAGFMALAQIPLGKVWSCIVFVLVTTFFVTSANSGTYVMGMLTEKGDLNPSGIGKGLWGIIMGGMAVGVMVAGEFSGANAMSMCQTMSIVGAFPMLFVGIAAMPAMIVALNKLEK